jgi:hypothetical protein
MKPENHKSIALVASEAAIDFIRRDVSDHGEVGSERRALVDAWRESAERDFLGQIHFRVSQGDLIAVSGLNGELFNPRMGGPLPTDAMWLLSPEQESKALELLGQSKPDTRPVFTTPPNPREIPVLLRKLPPDTNILFRSNFGIRRGGTATVAEYVEILEEIIQRQSRDVYIVDEAAQMLADYRPGKSGSDWAKDLRAAHRSGMLAIRSSSSNIPFKPKFPANNAVIPNHWTATQDAERNSQDVVRGLDIDHWLRATAGYGFPMPERTLIPATARPANRTVGGVYPAAAALTLKGALKGREMTTEDAAKRRRSRLYAAVTPRGSGGISGLERHRREREREAEIPMDWEMWRSMATVKLWEALVLSIGENPTRPMPSASESEVNVKYHTRLRVADSHRLSGGTLAPILIVDPGQEERVNLALFASWALSLGWQLPDEFPRSDANSATAAPIKPFRNDAVAADHSAPLAVPTAVSKVAKQPRKTWRDVAWKYIVNRMRAGKFPTAVELNYALHNEAGGDGSPFEKGEGQHRGSLWVSEISRPLALKTIQNHWKELKAASKVA